MDNTYPYMAGITAEKLLCYEMKLTANLLLEGFSDEEIKQKVFDENLYQYPTNKSLNRMSKTCLRRIHLLDDDRLTEAIVKQPTEVSKQICLYAMMLDSRLLWEFMLTVVGEKYRTQDSFFERLDVNTYLMRLEEQNDTVASWSDKTIKRIESLFINILVETDYLDNKKSTTLNKVLLSPILENAIKEKGDLLVLPAFNCFS